MFQGSVGIFLDLYKRDVSKKWGASEDGCLFLGCSKLIMTSSRKSRVPPEN